MPRRIPFSQLKSSLEKFHWKLVAAQGPYRIFEKADDFRLQVTVCRDVHGVEYALGIEELRVEAAVR